VTDLQLARDKQQGFEDWKRENAADKPLAMDLQVTVLTTGFWPSYKVCTAAECFEYCFTCFTCSNASDPVCIWFISLGFGLAVHAGQPDFRFHVKEPFALSSRMALVISFVTLNPRCDKICKQLSILLQISFKPNNQKMHWFHFFVPVLSRD